MSKRDKLEGRKPPDERKQQTGGVAWKDWHTDVLALKAAGVACKDAAKQLGKSYQTVRRVWSSRELEVKLDEINARTEEILAQKLASGGTRVIDIANKGKIKAVETLNDIVGCEDAAHRDKIAAIRVILLITGDLKPQETTPTTNVVITHELLNKYKSLTERFGSGTK